MRAILAAAVVVTCALPVLPAGARDAVVAQLPDDKSAAAIVPPVPRPAQRPSRMASEPDRLPEPIVPPEPQPAVRPLRQSAIAAADHAAMARVVVRAGPQAFRRAEKVLRQRDAETQRLLHASSSPHAPC
jgi:hypothetical protein